MFLIHLPDDEEKKKWTEEERSDYKKGAQVLSWLLIAFVIVLLAVSL